MNGTEGLSKVSPAKAGYMELSGAKKDAGCQKVSGKVSKSLGCCNLFQPESKSTRQFRCGSCEYLIEDK